MKPEMAGRVESLQLLYCCFTIALLQVGDGNMWYKPEMAGRVKTFYHTCRCCTDFTDFTAATVLLRLYYCFICTACSYATTLLL
jgi:hypothetical protein